MDIKANRYREQAAKLRIVADGTSDDTTRKSLLENIAEYERMTVALDTVAPGGRAQPKHPNI